MSFTVCCTIAEVISTSSEVCHKQKSLRKRNNMDSFTNVQIFLSSSGSPFRKHENKKIPESSIEKIKAYATGIPALHYMVYRSEQKEMLPNS